MKLHPYGNQNFKRKIVAFGVYHDRFLVAIDEDGYRGFPIIYEFEESDIGPQAFKCLVELADSGKGLYHFIQETDDLKDRYSRKFHDVIDLVPIGEKLF